PVSAQVSTALEWGMPLSMRGGHCEVNGATSSGVTLSTDGAIDVQEPATRGNAHPPSCTLLPTQVVDSDASTRKSARSAREIDAGTRITSLVRTYFPFALPFVSRVGRAMT